ncbi:serine acetyltransferase 1, chloroplastic-like [Juglans microcarpa x Juglans regia]|uniref:serine acetyltransferase 1, chloroplastic-like n=1 Tax=Juglans microcarpa x Juglans regia TaxID=2249226 RepID=UPI001B7E56AA|nr:serine acetyltransferase 1, chloroplastic-like [Juglans microcarpa x Juglans regia]
MKALVLSHRFSVPLYTTTSLLLVSNPNAVSANFPCHTSVQTFPPILISKQQNKSVAACIGASRTDITEPKPLSRDPNRSQYDDNKYNYVEFCRPSFPLHFSYKPICPDRSKIIHTDANRDEVDQDEDYGADLWVKMQDEARFDVEQEPILSNFYYNSILSHDSLERALANHLSMKLSNSGLPTGTLYDIFVGVLVGDNEIMGAAKDDLRAVKERDPACISYVHCFLNFKGFLACQAHRVAHKLWSQGRKVLALLIQNRVSEVFAVDIHPGARIGRGILLDHATGVVVGETAVIGNNVSILHNVTLGGTGKMSGDRHPKIGDGVLIGAGTCILGNIWIGDGAKIGAGSVVLKDVPPRTTAVGNPARLVGGKNNPLKLDKIPSFTMDHTSHITEWSDYVI